MPLSLDWQQITLRLLLSFVAGLLIGMNRTEHGRPAGLRTNILVCLAACVAMVQANLLLSLAGKRPDSFIVLDLMRLPLGILSGMGFIGGGAILRKGEFVLGVTTAATLWFVTVLGLCFGGGQLALGMAGTLLGIFVLWFLKLVENRMPQDRRGTLSLSAGNDALTEEAIRAKLASVDCKVISSARTYAEHAQLVTLKFEVQWKSRANDSSTPAFVEELAHYTGVSSLSWQP
jgi:putative Mg2+ transporter-C (MgtC) family protein